MILIGTCGEYPHPTPSLKLLIESLHAAGRDVAHAPWKTTDPKVFAEADLVLPICCWDYHDEPDRFLQWIDEIVSMGARLCNGPETLRWNFRKTYLLDLAARSLPVPATCLLPKVDRQAVERQMAARGWDVAVLKPVSGQSGYGVTKLAWADRAEWDLAGLNGRDVLLQEYQPDIGSNGETTLTFIDGVFSHAVRRQPGPGEWRANIQYGVSFEPVAVDQRIVQAASRYLEAAPERPGYARVDGIIRPDGFMLMELELIEPYLYLEFAGPEAVAAFTEMVLRRL
ncbi:ATP-grasp domain-containing protein [Microvirga flavescens]|uniref:ATP-grasp domain-containing protein n=1 Tax=Microvirga flavescens TaxID=2249811 RepID=UPI000DD5C642|nr:glutathione synthetase [Microvirga flavescens]